MAEDTPVIIDASGNEGGVDLNISSVEQVTFLGSTMDDRFAVDTANSDATDQGIDFNNDQSVVINNALGDNYYDIETYALELNDVPVYAIKDASTDEMLKRLEATLVNRLESWLKGRTAIIATHRMPILSLTSRTLILHGGRMTVDGPRDEVLAHIAGSGAPVQVRGKIA